MILLEDYRNLKDLVAELCICPKCGEDRYCEDDCPWLDMGPQDKPHPTRYDWMKEARRIFPWKEDNTYEEVKHLEGCSITLPDSVVCDCGAYRTLLSSDQRCNIGLALSLDKHLAVIHKSLTSINP